ncbi:MAG: peptidoglycan editing factor PgeF [Candidatus Promineifilaceae bacterium]
MTRQGGVSPPPYDSLNLSISVDDSEANVFANRASAYSVLNRSNETLVHAHLSHSALVAGVTSDDYGKYMGPADGLVSKQQRCGLTMNYADCSPILLYDPKKKAIGLGHAGWKGAILDLPRSLVRAMQTLFGSEPASLVAAIGPSIGPCCYQIGETVITAIEANFDDSSELLFPDEGNDQTDRRRRFDLPEANRRRLKDAGVINIEMAELCTACRTDLFYSHRAENGRTGRFGVLLLLGS